MRIHRRKKVARNLLVVAVMLAVCGLLLRFVFHIPFEGWLLYRWLQFSGWFSGKLSFGLSLASLTLSVLSLAYSIVEKQKQKNTPTSMAYKAPNTLTIVFGIIFVICLGGGITGAIMNITVVPKIQGISYMQAAKKCETAGLSLPYSAEQEYDRIEFQFPTKGSIISRDSDVFTWETLDIFLRTNVSRTVDSLFRKVEETIDESDDENDEGEEHKEREEGKENSLPSRKDSNSASDMLATCVLDEGQKCIGFLYGWVIFNKDGKNTLSDFYYWEKKEPHNTNCDRLRIFNYEHDIYFRRVRTATYKDIHYSIVDDEWLYYNGYNEETDDEGKTTRWDYIGFNSYRYTTYNVNREKTYESVSRLNKEGKGTYDNTIIDGQGYKGQYSNNGYNGKGTYVYSDGEVYKGHFVDGWRSGKGKLTKDGKTLFKGEWKDDERWTGKGIEETVFDDGSSCTYKGSWLNGEYNGKYELTDRDSDGTLTFKGTCADGEPIGYGEVSCTDGKYLLYTIGEIGTYLVKYKGNFSDDESGTGYIEYYSDDGSSYQGECIGSFDYAEPNGEGVLLMDGEVVFDGEWKDGERWTGQGKEETVDDDGVVRAFEGNWLNGEYDGYGEWWTINAAGEKGTYSGEFKNTKRNGYGEYHYPDGNIYKGNWKDDLREGKGKLYDKNGVLIQDGTFKDNEYVGE